MGSARRRRRAAGLGFLGENKERVGMLANETVLRRRSDGKVTFER